MIMWLKSLLFKTEIEKYKDLEKRIKDVERASSETQYLVSRQSELLAAIAGVQYELIAAVSKDEIKKVKIKDSEIDDLNLFTDDDEFIN